MTQPKDLEWLIKCRKCKHCYQIQAEADEIRCRLKYCRYEPLDAPKNSMNYKESCHLLAESEDKE